MLSERPGKSATDQQSNRTYLIRRTDVEVDGGHAVFDGGPGVEPLQSGDVHRVDRVRHVLVVILRESS